MFYLKSNTQFVISGSLIPNIMKNTNVSYSTNIDIKAILEIQTCHITDKGVKKKRIKSSCKKENIWMKYYYP